MVEAGGAAFEDFRARVDERVERQPRAVRSLLEFLENQRNEARRGERHFTSLTADQLAEKLRRTNSPMIVSQSWNGNTGTPGQIDYQVGVFNPDPVERIWLFVHLFVGPANVAEDLTGAVTAVDPRFPRLTEPEFSGLQVPAGGSAQLAFGVPVPAGIEPSNYLGNSVLFASTWHDPAEFLDRSLFVFRVA
jgi:hypothetical protein